MNGRRLVSTGLAALAAALASLLTSSARAEPSLVVRGDSGCPSADMIRAALFAARPGGDLPQQPIAVDVAGDRLILSLGEAPAARREIPADPDCAVRAASVAVVVAAWSGELVSRPSDSPTLTAASPPTVLTAVVQPVRHTAPVIEVDGGIFYSPAWGHAPGASVGAGRTPRDGGAGVRLLGAYQSAHDVLLEGGTNEVQRFIAGAAVTYQLERRRFFAAGDAGLVGTLTRAQGAGYAMNRAATAANIGAVAELRGGLRWGRARLWANARLLRLVHDETVKIQSSSPGVADSATLSAWDAQLGVGVGFLFE